MKLWSILIPTISNEGKPFRTKHHRVWDAKVRSLTGGLTVMPKTICGQWLDESSGILYKDKTLPVYIACDDDSKMEIIADFAAKHYKQLAIMYYVVSNDVRIINYDPVTFKRKKKKLCITL